MPYKDPEQNKQAKRKWDLEHKAVRAAYKKTILDRRRERTWRFRLWEAAHMSAATKEIISQMSVLNEQDELNRPFFIVDFNGRRHIETLDEPLPQW